MSTPTYLVGRYCRNPASVKRVAVRRGVWYGTELSGGRNVVG